MVRMVVCVILTPSLRGLRMFDTLFALCTLGNFDLSQFEGFCYAGIDSHGPTCAHVGTSARSADR